MVDSKNKLKFYLAADRIMNRGKEHVDIKERIYRIFFPDYVMKYLVALRKEEFYSNCGWGGILPSRIFNRIELRRLGIKLGFSISTNVFGYGLVIPHYGTIVVGDGNKIGNYAVLHTSTCITAGKKTIGDAMYLSTGAKIVNDIILGNGINISANAVVNKSEAKSNVLLVGNPASMKKESEPWYVRDGEEYSRRVALCEEYRKKMLG